MAELGVEDASRQQQLQAAQLDSVLAACPYSLVPVPKLTSRPEVQAEWRLRIGDELAEWLRAYPLRENFWQEPPRQHYAPGNKINSDLERAWFRREIDRLLTIGALRESIERPRRLHPCRLAPKKGVKLYRLVINMRSTNHYLRYVEGVYEDIRDVIKMLERNYWFVTRDMTDAYFMVHLREEDVTYLGFSWEGKYYVFLVLPFGLSDSPGVFTTIIGNLVRYWRRKFSMSITSFFDDVTWAHRCKEMVSRWSAQIEEEARQLGITFDPVKGNPEPTQCGVVLGFLIDTRSLTLSIPDAGLVKITDKANALLDSGVATMRQLYSLASSLMTFKRASLLASTRAYRLYAACRGRRSWDSAFPLPSELRPTLQWVRDELRHHATRRFGWEAHEKVWFHCDASATGCSMVRVDPTTKAPIGGDESEMRVTFTADESGRSSNNRELRTYAKGFRAFGPLLRGKVVQACGDNLTSIAYLAKGGGPVAELLDLATEALEVLEALGADLLPPIYIPGEQNVFADQGSRTLDLEDYRLREVAFHKISKEWGPFSTDRFADETNALLPIFNSRFQSSGAAAIDAFKQTWNGNEYLFPPLSRLGDVVDKILRDRAHGVLIVPVDAPGVRATLVRLAEHEQGRHSLSSRDLRVGLSNSPVPEHSSNKPFSWTAIRFNARLTTGQLSTSS